MLQELFDIKSGSDEHFAPELDGIIEDYARSYHALLTPLYHVVPWGDLIVDRDRFYEIYERTRALMPDFAQANAGDIASVLEQYPASLMVFRMITGYTWNELSDILRNVRDTAVSAGKLKAFERCDALSDVPGPAERNRAHLHSIAEAVWGIIRGELMRLPEDMPEGEFRTRQHKVDTTDGWETVERCAAGGVGYVDLLYERYTCRPFAYVRDALSEKKGDILEKALMAFFEDEGIPYDPVPVNSVDGWLQAPDYFLPDRESPVVALEAKIAADGGTARDKASRIERLALMCAEQDVMVVAAVDGKGFRRFNDVMLPIIRNTEGRTYTLQNLEEMLEIDRIAALRGRAD
jgi:hypothetical protein